MYSSGRKNRTVPLPDGTMINVNYGFLSLFFVFNFTFGYKYSLMTQSPEGGFSYKPLTKEEATALNGGKVPTPPIWERYSFLIFLAILAVVMIVRAVTG